jgi:hypothetical protein
VSAATDPGTVVIYHGTRDDRHGFFIIAGSHGGGLTLLSAAWPNNHKLVMRHVRPVSVTPAGELVALCAWCFMPAALDLRAACPNHGAHNLPCAEHAHPVPSSFALADRAF